MKQTRKAIIFCTTAALGMGLMPMYADAVGRVPTDYEDKVTAESGDAYLAIADGAWYAQYWGDDDSVLSYDAGVVPITGNGNYTVSVNGASVGMQKETENYIPTGASFLSVIVKDGAALYPDMAITVTGIRVNGEEIPMTAKNCTYSDTSTAADMRGTIYDPYADTLPEGAHDASGLITDSSAYSMQIIDASLIGAWTSVEVNFTISGAENFFLLGDVDGDSAIAISDATEILTIYARRAAGMTVSHTEQQLKSADADRNGTIDIADASAVLTYYAKKAAGLDAAL
ncbi:MAG: hypothetical protein IJ512_03240 [Ruminococcus sp.]|nr:hypothetical protein [Ruminococcus sp.]